jgi:hypothetical protein
MGEDLSPEGRPGEMEPDEGESRFVLPPVERAPFAGRREKARAVLRVIEQAERERAADS